MLQARVEDEVAHEHSVGADRLAAVPMLSHHAGHLRDRRLAWGRQRAVRQAGKREGRGNGQHPRRRAPGAGDMLHDITSAPDSAITPTAIQVNAGGTLTNSGCAR